MGYVLKGNIECEVEVEPKSTIFEIQKEEILICRKPLHPKDIPIHRRSSHP